MVPDSAGPPAPAPDDAPGGPPPGLSVRVPPRTPARSPGAGRPETRAQAVQRAAADAGITGVPVRAAPSKPVVQRTGPEAGAEDTPDAAPANRMSGAEVEELARRLIDPLSRLLRADLRRGRERSGRLHDGRRWTVRHPPPGHRRRPQAPGPPLGPQARHEQQDRRERRMTDNIFATSVFFKLAIGGSDLGAFHTCSGLGAEVEMETYAEGGNNGFTWHLPGRITWTNITLTRPVTADTMKIARWLNETIRRVEPKDGEIVALRPDLSRIISWQVHGIVPVRWQGPSFDPADSQAAIETLEIAHEGLEPS